MNLYPKHQINPLISLFVIFSLFLASFGCGEKDQDEDSILTLIDADGNVYQTIKMGKQIWMAENLKTTKYNDGSPITLYTVEKHGNNWGSINNQEAFYQWAATQDLNNVVDKEMPFDYYGAMYNHFAIESGKLAPKGWRIPTEADFRELEKFLASEGHSGDEAAVLKTATGWLTSSGGGTNLYGFDGLPNGYGSAFGTSTFSEGICTWATADVSGESLPSKRRVLVSLFKEKTIWFDDAAIQVGAGIRLIKE
ncbi:fibrobacter succinogenes major paralogous domain-containing protein [Algoriphagus marinus]|uniref:fibrobacter succinogenes major paralogous domain-containing protein n=1 Tax=Algoriphagus marinus TaxID=1925762 RepID=UPI00094BBD86|nr:fibrobacter succinogenes major paralogous domain-containing protein [Algoriphagus marinus]